MARPFSLGGDGSARCALPFGEVEATLGCIWKIRNAGIMLRLFARYFLLSLVALLLVLIGLVTLPVGPVVDDVFKECKTAPNAKCLTDWGFAVAMSEMKRPGELRGADWLAQMGRFEEAVALQLRIEVGNGKAPEDARAIVDRRFASYRLSAAIRSGAELEEAVETIPGTGPGALWISGLDFLGRNPYGKPVPPSTGPDERARGIVQALAERIEAMAREEAPRAQGTHLVYAAELFAALGNRDGAVGALRLIPDEQRFPIIFSADLIGVVGVETALEIYRRVTERSPHILLRAAAAEPDAEKARAYLEEAYDALLSDAARPDFGQAYLAVQRAAELGHGELALNLARRMAQRAETDEGAFKVFANIDAAEALYVADAPVVETRAAIDTALSLFPENPSKVLGIGLVSGPILWEKSGLEAQATRKIAKLLVGTGAVEEAVQLLKPSVFSWGSLLSPEIPLKYYDEVLRSAGEVLSVEDLAKVRTHLAAKIFSADATPAQQDWALRTVREVIEQKQLSGIQTVASYASILRIARKTGSDALEDAALDRIAAAAIASRRYYDLIRAGYEWHLSGRN